MIYNQYKYSLIISNLVSLLLLNSNNNGVFVVVSGAVNKQQKLDIPDSAQQKIQQQQKEPVVRKRIQPKDPRLEQVIEVPVLGLGKQKQRDAKNLSKQKSRGVAVENCEDTHLNQMECKEWAWFGEWYAATLLLHNTHALILLLLLRIDSFLILFYRITQLCSSISFFATLKPFYSFSSRSSCSEKNPKFMHEGCKKSCNMCETPSKSATSTTASSNTNELALYHVGDDDDDCQDWFATCTEWSEKGNGQNVENMCYGQWHSNKGTWIMTGAYVVEFCPKACNTCDIHLDDRDITLGLGVPQSFPAMDDDKELKNFIKGKVAETRAYINSIQNEEIKAVCKMSHPHCARYALSSDCSDKKDHPLMKYGCAAACQTCENLIHNNGIFEAEHMWTNALKDWNDANDAKKDNKTVKKGIGVSAA